MGANVTAPDPTPQKSSHPDSGSHARPPRRAGDAKAGSLLVSTFGCETVADVTPQALGLTYWFDAAEAGEPYPVKIRFSGRRIGVKRKPGPRDAFRVVESIDHVVPGSGRIAVTARISDVDPGEWHVTATPASETRSKGRAPGPASRRASLPKAATSGTTVFAPIVGVRAPGAHLGAWPGLVSLGVVVALLTQAVLVSRAQLPEAKVLLLSLVASVVGLVGRRS